MVFDFDADGWLDLFVGNGAVTHIEELARAGDPYPLHQRNQLYRNLGQGAFEEVDPTGQPFLNRSEVSRGVAAGDVDHDGDTDLVVFNNAGPARLLISNQDDSAQWLGLDLRIAWGSRTAVGAKIGVFRAGAATQWRRVRHDGGYASSHDSRVLVGLGQSTEADRVQIEWPGGRRVEWRGQVAGRYVLAVASQKQGAE